jgi:WhiB family redox-sensing transcriptional regulator
MTARLARSQSALLATMPDFIPEGTIPACRGVDPELFFPIGDHYSAEGRAICGRCALQVACASWAIRSNERFGLWGGLDPEQRASIRRRAVREERDA